MSTCSCFSNDDRSLDVAKVESNSRSIDTERAVGCDDKPVLSKFSCDFLATCTALDQVEKALRMQSVLHLNAVRNIMSRISIFCCIRRAQKTK